MENEWEKILSHPLIIVVCSSVFTLLATAVGLVSGYLKDMRELEYKKQAADEDRKHNLLFSEKNKAYDERKSAYTDLIASIKIANEGLGDISGFRDAQVVVGRVALFCSDDVLVFVNKTINSLGTNILANREKKALCSETYDAFSLAYENMITAMRHDLNVHKVVLSDKAKDSSQAAETLNPS